MQRPIQVDLMHKVAGYAVSTDSNLGLASVYPIRSSNKLGTTPSNPSGSAEQSGYSASIVTSSGLTSVNPTTILKNIGTASNSSEYPVLTDYISELRTANWTGS